MSFIGSKTQQAYLDAPTTTQFEVTTDFLNSSTRHGYISSLLTWTYPITVAFAHYVDVRPRVAHITSALINSKSTSSVDYYMTNGYSMGTVERSLQSIANAYWYY